ncbi:MAG: RNA-directed DNA polymerase, partial [Planctomycetes bacterium]|nr:RNA-directed DNA polymerase [Planctomycetota bacterium]
MVPERLEPRFELLREEYVLVQAWKKTASYIRYHSWFSDTLVLDRAAVNLPAFLGELRERLQSADTWQNDSLRIVPAPKSQRWRVRKGTWEPVERRATAARLRPLAHVSIADQVVGTALMLCLADRVETLQGDPDPRRSPVRKPECRKRVVSYGNRLFCDAIGAKLCHRWGSAKLYRAYYQDYRTFISRPEVAAESTPVADERRVHVVYTDLRQFYDRVRPALLASAIDQIRRDDDDPEFFSLAKSVLDWGWDPSDQRNEIPIYTKQADIDGFTRVALPQGLVASGFFANVVLLSFDEALRTSIGTEIIPGILLADACRYVDDLRILVAVEANWRDSSDALGKTVTDWLGRILSAKAPGLMLSPDPKKTRVAALSGDERPLVRQSARMNRIQSAVSGGFDALGGE